MSVLLELRTRYPVQRPDYGFGVLPSFRIAPIRILLLLDRAATVAAIHRADLGQYRGVDILSTESPPTSRGRGRGQRGAELEQVAGEGTANER